MFNPDSQYHDTSQSINYFQIPLYSSHVTVGPEDLHPRDASDPADAETQLHAQVLLGAATRTARRKDQPD